MPRDQRRPLTAPLMALLLLAPLAAVSAYVLAPASVPSSKGSVRPPLGEGQRSRSGDTSAAGQVQREAEPITVMALGGDAQRGSVQPAPAEPANPEPSSHHQSPQAELAFLQQRRVGEAMQVEARERSLALIAQASGALSLSADDLRALQAREAKLEQRIDRHRRRLATTDRRIAALEASHDPANQAPAEELP